MLDWLVGRLNLRWQAAVAVLLPCFGLGLFSALYFPSLLNAHARDALEQRADALGGLAVGEAGPSMRLILDGLAHPADLDRVLDGIRRGGDVKFAGVMHVTPATKSTVEGRASVTVSAEDKEILRGAIDPGSYAMPVEGCAIDHKDILVLRCAVRDGAAEGMLIAGFHLDKLIQKKRQNTNTGLLVAMGALGLGLALALLFSRMLAAPVDLVTRAAREVALGDVTVSEVQVVAAAEIQSMATSFNEMLANLRNLVGQMVSLTARLSNASQGLIGASADQEQVTSMQSAYAQQIAATFEELSRTAEQISESTQVVETAARRTNEAVEEARAVLSQTVAAIADSRSESKAVADAILKLNADLQQVGRIAQLINSVAERSDLLALNAALEGTKAGEVGRGFSLVAAEMRKLAENVAASARDIGSIVGRIQQSGEQAVSIARSSVSTSDKGVKVAEKASEFFQRIFELARGTTEAAQQIAVATKQQRQSSEQAVSGARNVAELVKRGVDATGRTTKIAADLQSVAQALTEVTGRFKVRNDPQA